MHDQTHKRLPGTKILEFRFLLRLRFLLMKVDEVTIKLAFRAAKSGESKLLSQLLEKHGSSLANDRNEHNDTPLMFAAMTGLHTVVRCLLKHGSDVYAKNDDDSTALMTAAMSGNAKCVRLLLNASTEDD
eukprot:153811_1